MDLSQETAGLLREVGTTIRAHVVLEGEQCIAVALWVLHTHAFEAAEVTPYLHITSAEKRSGKTRLLEVLDGLVREPLMTVNISDAALFRMLDRRPTLLLDECDAIFALGSRQEDKRALLNAGHRRSGRVYRCEPTSLEPRAFDVFSAKALAGIGWLPDTIADRSIEISLQRKLAGEGARPLRHHSFAATALELGTRIERWAPRAIPVLRASEPIAVSGLDDRAADGWEPLLAIAEMAGYQLTELAREAARRLSGPHRQSVSSTGVELLSAVKRAFDSTGADCLATAELILLLSQQEERPYEEWWDSNNNRPSKGAPRRLAGALRPYRVHPHDLRVGAQIRKGYRKTDFGEPWARNLPHADLSDSQPAVSPNPMQP